MTYPKHIVSTASLIFNQIGQVLLVKTESRGWEIPGGQVEEGEDVLTALSREIFEESGVSVHELRLSALYSNVTEPTKIIIDFISEFKDGVIRKDNEIIDVGWFDPENALVHVKNDSMKYRLQWLLENKNKIRCASYSKKPFRVLSETIL